MLFAMYVPHLGRAILMAYVQLFLLGLLWVAMYSYAKDRCGANRAARYLVVTALLPTVAVLAFGICVGLGELGDGYRRMSGEPLPDFLLALVIYVELWWFSISTFVSLLVGLVLLVLTADGQESSGSEGPG